MRQTASLRTALERGASWDVDAMRGCLERNSFWEINQDSDDTEVRRVFLGTWINCSPSGKIYAPFAHGNMPVCPHCHGEGVLRTASGRHARLVRQRDRTTARMRRRGYDWARLTPKGQRKRWDRAHKLAEESGDSPCHWCGNMGSIEAYHDDLWRDYWTERFENAGLSIEFDDDIWCVEYRDRPEPDAWACVDCYYHVAGVDNEPDPSWRGDACEAGINRLCAPDENADEYTRCSLTTGDRKITFTWSACDVCGSGLGGERHEINIIRTEG